MTISNKRLLSVLAVTVCAVAGFIFFLTHWNRTEVSLTKATPTASTEHSRPQRTSPTPTKSETSASANDYAFDFNTRDPVIFPARQTYIAKLNEIQRKNAKLLFQRRFPHATMVGLAISAPTADDIGIASESLSAILERVEPAKKAIVREYLVGLYKAYTDFTGPYQVVYATLRDDSDKIVVMSAVFDELSDALPDDNGIVVSRKESHAYSSDDPVTGWRGRYGDLIRFNNGAIEITLPR